MKELFGQSLVNTVSDSDRVAVAIPGQVAAKNILFSKFRDQLKAWFGTNNWTAKTYESSPAIVVVNNVQYILNETLAPLPFVSTDFAAELLLGYWVSGGGSSISVATNSDMDSGTLDTVFISPLKFAYGITTRIFIGLNTTAKNVLSAINELLVSINLRRLKTEIGDAHGFVNPPNDSNFTISNTGASVTVNLLVNAGDYKINGTDYVNTGLSLTFTASLGQNQISLNASGLMVSAFDILDLTKISVCTVNWDGTNVRLSDELHRSNRNLIQHKKEHDTDGSRWVSGLSTTFGAGATNTFSSSLGVIRDEERYHSIASKSIAQIAYRNAAQTAMIFNTPSTAYAKLNTGIPTYDNAGVQTNLATSQYGVMWMYATNGKLPVNSEIVFVQGQGTYMSIANAQAAPQPTLVGMSVAEWKLLYRVIIRNIGGVLSFIQADDFRLTSTGLAVSGGGLTSLNASQVSTTPTATLLSTDQAATNAELDLKKASRKIADLVNSANVIDIDWTSLQDFNSSNRVAVSVNASITYTNATNAQFATFKVLISNLATITFPTGSISGDTRVSTRVFTPTGNGNYTISIYKTTTEYEVVISTNPAI